MIILGIETSCDETAAAVLQKSGNRVTILSNIVASSAKLQSKYGGVIPEQAAREQIRSIIPVIEKAISQAAKTYEVKSENLVGQLDAIAVTFGPGLIGSLLVGVETAKTLALVWEKPLVPVNHLIGHFYANWLTDHLPGVPQAQHHLEGVIPTFPCIGLLVSGGHTDLVLFKNHGKYKYLGGTRDDAAGECFDKCARLLDLPYPGGPEISKLAQTGNSNSFNLPRPMIDSKDFDFSFSGLKTAVANLLKECRETAKSQATKKCCAVEHTTVSMPDHRIRRETNTKRATGRASGFLCCDELANLSASIEQAIVDVLVNKTIKATQMYNVKQIIVAGGVAANQKLVSEFKKTINDKQSLRSNDLKRLTINLHIPPPDLCTDNAAMIASAAFFNYHPINPFTLQANPNLSLNIDSSFK